MKKILCPLLIIFSVFSIAQAQSDEFTRLVEEGISLHDKGNYTEALEKYKQAVVLNPESGLIHYEMSLTYHRQGDYTNAIKHADIAISKGGSTELSAYLIKGSATDDAGDTKSALKIYEKGMKRFPDDYLLQFNYGISSSRLGKKEEAEKAYIKAIQLKPEHPTSNLVLAYLNLDKGNNIKGILGLYFYLLLENNTPRAKAAFDRLYETMYGGVSIGDDGKNTTINLNMGDNDSDMAVELGLKMIIMESAKKNADKNRYERMVLDTDSFFQLVSEINDNAKKDKKGGKNIWSEIYGPVLNEIHEKGYTETFIYHIASASQDPVVMTWIENNQDKMNAFYKWVEGN